MIDKEKILAKIEFLLNEINYEPFTDEVFGRIQTLKELKSYIDSLQEEPIKIKKGCKYRCLCDMTNKDTGNISFIGGKIYLAPEDNTLVSEENGWRCDTSENASNFELIEEPISKELEEASKEWLAPQLDKSYENYGETKMMELTHFDGYAMLDAIEFGAKWKEQQITAKDIDGKLYSTLCGSEQNVVDYVGYSEYCKRLK